MKRRDLIKHLLLEGVVFWREGAKHSVYYNPTNSRVSTVPRHSETNNQLARKICLDLGISLPKKK